MRTASLAVTIWGVGVTAWVSHASDQRVAFVQAPREFRVPAAWKLYDTIVARRYVPGMRLVLSSLPRVAETMRVVTPDFVCATDPTPRRLVDGLADCIQPIYLPDGTIVFASLLTDEYEQRGGYRSVSLYALRPGAKGPSRLTFNPGSDFDPTVLPDGRILYRAWEHVGNHHWPRGVVALMTINADGTGLFPFTGNHRGPWLKRGARFFGDDRIAFVGAGRSTDFGMAVLSSVPLNDAFAPYVTANGMDGYEVAGVASLSDGGLLLAARQADEVSGTFGLFAHDGTRLMSIYDDPNCHELSPAVGVRTKPPERRISTVVPGTPQGYLLLLNVRETDGAHSGMALTDAVRSVRVIEGLPARRTTETDPTLVRTSGQGNESRIQADPEMGWMPSRILGEVAPAADGSVFVKVPADRPLRIQLLDREGFALINERAWFWVRPNERRVCIGCHENRELSPHNATPLAATQAPVDLTDSAGWESVSFGRDIHPILKKTCAVSDCHVPPNPTGGLNLASIDGNRNGEFVSRYSSAYASLLERQPNKPAAIGGRRIHPGDARRSPLMWLLYGRVLAPQYAPAPFDTPIVEAHPGPDELTPAEIDLIRKWIDLGAPYDDDAVRPASRRVRSAVRTENGYEDGR